MHYHLKRNNGNIRELSAKESAINFLKNTNKVFESASDAERQHLTKGTSDDDTNRNSEGVDRYNQCISMLNHPPINKAFDYLDLQIRYAMDPKGASYTSSHGNIRAHHGASAACQRGINTGLFTPHIFHEESSGHAGAGAALLSARSVGNVDFEDIRFGQSDSSGGSGRGRLVNLSCSLFSHSDSNYTVSGGDGLGNDHG